MSPLPKGILLHNLKYYIWFYLEIVKWTEFLNLKSVLLALLNYQTKADLLSSFQKAHSHSTSSPKSRQIVFAFHSSLWLVHIVYFSWSFCLFSCSSDQTTRLHITDSMTQWILGISFTQCVVIHSFLDNTLHKAVTFCSKICQLLTIVTGDFSSKFWVFTFSF